jgi:hypothetical protein
VLSPAAPCGMRHAHRRQPGWWNDRAAESAPRYRSRREGSGFRPHGGKIKLRMLFLANGKNYTEQFGTARPNGKGEFSHRLRLEQFPGDDCGASFEANQGHEHASVIRDGRPIARVFDVEGGFHVPGMKLPVNDRTYLCAGSEPAASYTHHLLVRLADALRPGQGLVAKPLEGDGILVASHRRGEAPDDPAIPRHLHRDCDERSGSRPPPTTPSPTPRVLVASRCLRSSLLTAPRDAHIARDQ